MPKQRSPRAHRRSATNPEKEAGLSTNRFCVMLTLETADPSLTHEAMMETLTSAEGMARTRRAILAGLPRSVKRLVAILPEDEAAQLFRLHEIYGENIAEQLGKPRSEGHFLRPTPEYVPPHDPGERHDL
jgi:hypothetical protein